MAARCGAQSRDLPLHPLAPRRAFHGATQPPSELRNADRFAVAFFQDATAYTSDGRV
jgi:hypothetical protein